MDKKVSVKIERIDIEDDVMIEKLTKKSRTKKKKCLSAGKTVKTSRIHCNKLKLKVIKLIENGKSYESIVRSLGISHSLVAYYGRHKDKIKQEDYETSGAGLKTHKTYKTFSYEVKLEAIRRIENGESFASIGRILGMSGRNVSYYSKQKDKIKQEVNELINAVSAGNAEKIPRTHKTYSNEVKLEVIKRIENDEPISLIAMSIGMSERNVSYYKKHKDRIKQEVCELIKASKGGYTAKVRRNQNTYSNSVKLEAIERIENGESLTSIALSLGMSRYAVAYYNKHKDTIKQKLISKASFTPMKIRKNYKSETYSDEIKLEAIKRIERGESCASIGRSYGISRWTIANYRRQKEQIKRKINKKMKMKKKNIKLKEKVKDEGNLKKGKKKVQLNSGSKMEYVKCLNEDEDSLSNFGDSNFNDFKKTWTSYLEQNVFSQDKGESLSCSKCSFTTKSNNELNSHFFKHYEIKEEKDADVGRSEEEDPHYYKISLLNQSNPYLYLCSQCDFESEDITDITKHLDSHKVHIKKRFVCCICQYKTKDNYSLNIHMLNKHSDIKLFKCDICKYETNRKDNLQYHILNHKGKKKFKCSHCIFETNGKHHFDSHVTKHSLKQFQCFDCAFETNEQTKFKDHKTEFNHNSIGQLLTCAKCDFKTESKIRLNKHLSDHYVGGQIDCPECDFQTDLIDTFKNHILIHNEGKKLSCIKCGYSATITERFFNHLLNHYNLKLLSCHKCDFKTNLSGVLKIHLTRHKGVKFFKCSTCGYKTFLKHEFEKHTLKHITYKCPNCDFEANLKSEFQSHMKIHNMGLYICSNCDYKTKVKKDFLTHQKDQHSDNKLHKCTYCNYKTDKKFVLKIHLYNHMGVKIHKCTQCDYETNKRMRLQLHIKKHKTKQFQCADCEFESNDKDELEYHLTGTNHTPSAKLMTCDKCEYKTYRKNNFNLHLSAHSPNWEIKCPECPFKSSQKEKLGNHLLIHNDNMCFECMKCGFQSENKKVLMNHLLSHYNLNFLKCPICNFRTHYKQILHTHISKHSLKCGECEYETNQIKELKKHLLIHKSEDNC